MKPLMFYLHEIHPAGQQLSANEKGLLAFVGEYTNCPINNVYHILCLVGNIESETLANHAVPGSTEFLIQTSLDELCRRLSNRNTPMNHNE